MDFTLKIKALSRLAKSETAEAITAIDKEITKAISSLSASKNYKNVEESLKILEILGFRNSIVSIQAIDAFLQTIDELQFTQALNDNFPHRESTIPLTISAIDVLATLRYMETSRVTLLLLKLSYHPNDSIRRKAIEILEQTSQYNIDLFYGSDKRAGIGPAIQRIIMDTLNSLREPQLHSFFSSIQNIVTQILSPTISGTTWNYKSVTMRSGSVPGIRSVVEVRNEAISLLHRMYAIAISVSEKLQTIASLNVATRFEHRGANDASTISMINQDTVGILSFYRSLVAKEPLPIVQRIESASYAMFSHTKNEVVKSAALEVKAELSARAEYEIYRNLIGFEGVFGNWQELESVPENWRGDSEIRRAKATEYARSINQQNYEEWENRILEYAAVESNDLATFPIFFGFLGQFALSAPHLALNLITSNASSLEPFLVPILRALLSGEARSSTRDLIDHWITLGIFLYPSMRSLESSEHFDSDLAVRLLNRSIEVNDLATISAAVGVAITNFGKTPTVVDDLFMPAIVALSKQRNASWIFDSWYRPEAKVLLRHLNDEHIKLVLRSLLPLKSIDFHAEEVLYLIANSNSRMVLDFLRDRISLSIDDSESSYNFDAIPYRLHKLDKPLSSIPVEVIRAARFLYEKDKSLFQFRGARLVHIIFPEFSVALEEELIRLVRSGKQDDIEFVIDILRNFEGELFIHPVCQEIVRKLPADSKLLGSLAIALESTGVVTGEFGFVEAYRRKIEEVKTWLVDDNERIALFVNSYVADLEAMIASELKRVEEDIALQKHRYGESEENDVDGANQ